MKSSFWTPYLSDHAIHAICWTLIHSLWIGLVIALLSGLVISITRKSSAALRYNLLCGVLLLFTLSVCVTFFVEMRTPAVEDGPFRIGQVIHGPDNHILIIPATTTPHLSFFSRIVWLLNEYSNIIFMAWLLFFVLKSLKMAGGLLYIQRIRNYKVHEVSEEFKHKIDLFANQIGIRQTVRLVQSELVKVPVAVGWLKPMILLPMGILLQLSPEQLESILWHELAHIRRRDYLVNILQGLVETVFFFNPGLLWLSSLIRTEREACCDDMVLSRMHRKANYLEALLAFGNEDNSRISLAMGIGSGNQLYDRMKRMVDKENKRLSMAEKVVLIAGLVVLSAFTGLPKTTQNAVKHLVDVVIKRPGHTDTVKMKIKSVDSATKQSSEFHQIEVISKDTLHGKKDILGNFKSVLFKNSDADMANNDISAEDTTGKKYHFIVANNKLVAMEINGEKVQEDDLPKYQYMITQIDVAVLEKRHIRETDMARFKANHPDIKFTAGGAFEKKRFINPRFYKDSIYNVNLQKMREIIADLVANNILGKAADVKWFALTNTEFILDGEKQSDELQERYKAKYDVHEGMGLYYGPVPMTGKGVFIDPNLKSEAIKSRYYLDSIRSGSLKTRLKKNDINAYNLKLKAMLKRRNSDSINYAGQENRALNVIADLVHDKAVADPASVKWFGLSSTEFIVNGQKEPDEMQQRYKAKYGIYKDYGLYYGPVQMHGVGVFIDADPSRPPLPPGSPHPPKALHEPRSGYMQPKYVDPNAWKLQQLIKQQQAFAADQDKQRAKLMDEQQRFTEQENKKREQIVHQQEIAVRQQEAVVADQARKREQLLNQQQADKASERELIERQQALREDEEMAGLKQQWVSKSGINLQPVITSVISDLVSANVIHDKSDLVKFNLTNSALIVNGMKQPEELHKRLRAKYLEQPSYTGKDGITADPHFGLHFNAQNGHQGLGTTSGPDSP